MKKLLKKILAKKPTISEMLYEANLGSMIGSKKDALKWYYQALITLWDNNYINAVNSGKEREFIAELKEQFYTKIIDNGGKWPKQYDIKERDNEELDSLKAFYENGVYTEKEYEEQRQIILNRK